VEKVYFEEVKNTMETTTFIEVDFLIKAVLENLVWEKDIEHGYIPTSVKYSI